MFPHLSVLENVRIALQRARGNSLISGDRTRRSTPSTIARWRCSTTSASPASPPRSAIELPYGRSALEIASTLALDPQMLLLDEPTAGMGQEDIARTAALIKRVAADRTVLMVEHNLSVVSDLSDVITVLARGRVLAEGDYAAVSKNPQVIEAYMGSGHG